MKEALALIDKNTSPDNNEEQRLLNESIICNVLDSVNDELKESPDALVGRYVAVKITKASGPTLKGIPICLTSLVDTKNTKGYLYI